MGFFSRFRQQPKPTPQVEGLLGYYGLGEWWLTTFSQAERDAIEIRYQPMGVRPGSHPLTQGRIGFTSQTAVDFLSGLANWFRTVDDATIAQRIRTKMDSLSQEHPVSAPGYYRGRHYTTYIDEFKALKRSGDDESLEQLLLALVDATESESRTKASSGVAPAYYEELAILYRGRKDYAAEVAILERFKQQRHASGVKPPRLLERLEKARALLRKRTSSDESLPACRRRR